MILDYCPHKINGDVRQSNYDNASFSQPAVGTNHQHIWYNVRAVHVVAQKPAKSNTLRNYDYLADSKTL